jgi:hypothetical protein
MDRPREIVQGTSDIPAASSAPSSASAAHGRGSERSSATRAACASQAALEPLNAPEDPFELLRLPHELRHRARAALDRALERDQRPVIERARDRLIEPSDLPVVNADLDDGAMSLLSHPLS